MSFLVVSETVRGGYRSQCTYFSNLVARTRLLVQMPVGLSSLSGGCTVAYIFPWFSKLSVCVIVDIVTVYVT